jgi:hypothetical protein
MLPGYLFDNPPEYRKSLDIPVIVHGLFIIGLQMERIDHVEVTDIGGCGLIGDIDRMLQREIPNGKGFEFGITSMYAMPILVIDL